jgi:uncharacterized protein (DUF2344 family)
MSLDLKALLGETYKEEMTVEEITTALAGIDSVVVSATDYSNLVKKETLDKATSDAAEWKRKYNEKLTAEEKAKEAQKDRDKELETLRREKSINELAKQFVALGYDMELAEQTATAQIDGDTATLFKNMKAHEEAVKANLKDEKQKNTPTPPIDNKTPQTPTTKPMETWSAQGQVDYIASALAEAQSDD